MCIVTFKNYFWYEKVLCVCFGGWSKMCEVCVMGFMHIVTVKNCF